MNIPPPPPLSLPPSSPSPSSSSFPFVPPLNPNPNANFFPPLPHHHYHHPPSSSTTTTTTTGNLTPPPPPDLPSALSTLKNLIHLAQTTIHSISSILPTTTAATATATCPYNPHHRIPSDSLFSHSLRCPSSPLSFSLTSNSDFFYHDCPAVVTFPPNKTSNTTNHTPISLPPVLLNSMGNTKKGFSADCQIRFLPSETWFVKRETEAWSDYPALYSPTIHRVILFYSSNVCRIEDLMDVISRWVIVNSPSYGVVIDVTTRDHIILLFRLCLKAIASEAIDLLDTEIVEFSLKCPVLSQGLMWFGTQLSILYGEMNGKLFAIHMLRQLILNITKSSLMFSEESMELSSTDNKPSDGEILFSQVEDAVGALRKRSLLEEKIKAVLYTRQLNNSQRVAEHEYVSKQAEEVRKSRTDYRPITEYDVLLRQRSRDQESNIMKSREELLAEERDYKRRRMSYRGKKMKRSTTQVMRDIIEEYTEEIKAAGGFGCSLDEAGEARKVASAPFPVPDVNADNVKEKISSNLSEITSEGSPSVRNHLLTDTIIGSSKIMDESHKDKKRSRRDSGRYHGNLEDQNCYRDRHDREYNSRSPEKQRVSGRSRKLGRAQVSRKSLAQSPERNHTRSCERSSHQQDQVDRLSKDRGRRRRNIDRFNTSGSVSRQEFDDRYDPSESCDMHEDDLYSGGKHV